KSAITRYGTMAHRGHRARLGQGCTTGHQKMMDVKKKHACSAWCHELDRSASSYGPGTCQPNITTPISTRATTGFVSTSPIRWAGGQFRRGPANSRAANLGIPRTIGM